MTPPTLTTSTAAAPPPAADTLAPRWSQRLAELRQTFAVDFALVEVRQGELLHAPSDQPPCVWLEQIELCGEVARREQPEFLADEDPFVLLGLPLAEESGATCVALALFLLRPVQSPLELVASAEALGVDPQTLWNWASRQPVWNAHALQQMGRLLLEKWSSHRRRQQLDVEVEQITSHLLSTYEEISLLHRLTQNLKISRGEAQLGQLALEWLADVLPSEGLAILLKPTTESGEISRGFAGLSVVTHGAVPLDEVHFESLLAAFSQEELRDPLVVNFPERTRAPWPFPQIRGLIIVPLVEGEKIFGWLAAFNHTNPGEEFGTVEASLLGSVGAILGIHSGNLHLYRKQAEFLAGVVRALTSAIDAKDPYTCGHSDRVARIAMRLAEELGCDEETLDTIYLSGLLHDIGKIGIDDNVLRKPGDLTPEEYEHIKLHPELGYKILRDLKQLDQVLPVVLHHHEAWDGSGYPHKLAGENIPFLARIVAVADSFDAMSSDRPYRQGMPLEKLKQILRSGAGKQWDARVIEAFFAAHDDILDIAHHEREALRLKSPASF